MSDEETRKELVVETLSAMDRQIQEDIQEFIENRRESVEITRWICGSQGEFQVLDILPKDENTDRLNPIHVGIDDVTDLYLEIWKWHPKINRMIIDHIDNLDEMEEKDQAKSIQRIIRETSSLINRSLDLRNAINNSAVEVFSDPQEVSDLERLDVFRDASGRIISGAAPRTKYDDMYNNEIDAYEEEEKRLIENKAPRIKNSGATRRGSGLLGR